MSKPKMQSCVSDGKSGRHATCVFGNRSAVVRVPSGNTQDAITVNARLASRGRDKRAISDDRESFLSRANLDV